MVLRKERKRAKRMARAGVGMPVGPMPEAIVPGMVEAPV
jgi:hypothetical protein